MNIHQYFTQPQMFYSSTPSERKSIFIAIVYKIFYYVYESSVQSI